MACCERCGTHQACGLGCGGCSLRMMDVKTVNSSHISHSRTAGAHSIRRCSTYLPPPCRLDGRWPLSRTPFCLATPSSWTRSCRTAERREPLRLTWCKRSWVPLTSSSSIQTTGWKSPPVRRGAGTQASTCFVMSWQRCLRADSRCWSISTSVEKNEVHLSRTWRRHFELPPIKWTPGLCCLPAFELHRGEIAE